MEKILKFGDLGFGKCPHCEEHTTFFPTAKLEIYECESCDKKVRQYKNGKVHWYKLGDDFLHPQNKK